MRYTRPFLFAVFVFSFLIGLAAVRESSAQPSAQQFVTATTLKLDKSTATGQVLTTADFDRDGRADVLAITDAGLAVLLQQADGRFVTRMVGAAVSQGGVYRVGDINGDGVPDVVTTLVPQPDPYGHVKGTTTIHTYLGNGDGSFKPGWTAKLANYDYYDLVIGDWNGDGRNDLALTQNFGSSQQVLLVFMNEGHETFRALPAAKLDLSIGLLTAGDFNEDGKMDLVFATNYVSGTRGGVEILTGNGNGTFTPGARYALADSRYAQDLFPARTADLNRDGHLDLVVLSDSNSGVLLGKGDGTFRTAPNVGTSLYGNTPPPPVGGDLGALIRPGGIEIRDFNKDGIPDIAVVNAAMPADGSYVDNSVVAVFPGKGDGTFRDPRVYVAGAGGLSFAAADLSGDGDLDFVVGNQPAGNGGVYPAFSLLKGDRRDNFAGPVMTLSFNPSSLVVADLNGDHISDLAVVNPSQCAGCPGTLSVFLGTGKGYYGPVSKSPIAMKYGNVAAGDVNGDGKIDLVVTRSRLPAQDDSSAGFAGDTAVFFGRGNGTFAPAVTHKGLGPSLPYSYNRETYLLDVNHDKKLDLIGDWGVALGNGNGTFRKPIPFPLGSVLAISPGYFNRDGNLDLAVLQPADDIGGFPALFSLLGDGRGSFRVATLIDGGDATIYGTMTTADLNGDGIPDLMITSLPYSCNCSPYLSVQLGKGDGTFGPEVDYSLPVISTAIVVADFDRDGHKDILLPDATLLRGKGNGTFFQSQYPGPLSSLDAAVATDVNGDGVPDVVGITGIGIERLINSGKRGH